MLRCVFFRQSVLCRDSRRPVDAPDPAVLRDLHFAVRAGDPGDEQPEGLLGSALALLRSRAPDTLAFAELRAATSADPDELSEALHQGVPGRARDAAPRAAARALGGAASSGRSPVRSPAGRRARRPR